MQNLLMQPIDNNSIDIYLKEITFRQVGGGYVNQFSRPFDISGNKVDIDTTINAISNGWIDGSAQANANGLRYDTIGSHALSDVAGNLISPAAETYRANIAMKNNSWGEDRFILWAVFETIDHLQVGKTFRYIISGYTDSDDQLGITTTGNNLDPHMRLFINSIIKMEITEIPNGYGGFYEKCKIIHQDEVHYTGVSDYELRTSPRNKDMLMRPTDILDMCQTLEINGNVMMYDNDPSQFGVNTHLININNRIGSADKRLVLAKTENHSSVNMLTNILRGISIGHAENEQRASAVSIHHMNVTDGTGNMVYASAKNTAPIRESGFTMSGQYLLGLFKERMGYGEHPYIQYKDFVRMFPNATPAHNSCYVSLMPKGSHYTIRESQVMGGASSEQIEAFRMATSVSNIMFTNGFKAMQFIATNETRDGTWHIVPTNLISIRTTDECIVKQDWDIFVNNLLAQVLVPISTVRGGYSRDVTIEVSVDLMTDTNIWIRLDGGVRTPFTFPSFASSCYSPMRYVGQGGTNDNRIGNISSVMMELTESVFNKRESRDYLDKSVSSMDRTITGARTRPSRFTI